MAPREISGPKSARPHGGIPSPGDEQWRGKRRDAERRPPSYQGRRAVQLHEAVLDVTPAQGGWEEELGKEGGAAEKKEVALSPPESSLLCFCNRLRLHPLFFFCWDMGYQDYPAVRCPLPFPKSGAPSPIADMRTSPSFLARERAQSSLLCPSPAPLSPQPPWCDHLLPVCACAATAPLKTCSTSHSPKAKS